MVFRHMVAMSSARAWALFSVLTGAVAAAWLQHSLLLSFSADVENLHLTLLLSLLAGALLSAVMILAERSLRHHRRKAQFVKLMAQVQQILRTDETRDVRFSQILQALLALPHSGLKNGGIFIRAADLSEGNPASSSALLNPARQKWSLAVAAGTNLFLDEVPTETDADGLRIPGPVLSSLLTYLETPAAANGELQICGLCVCDPYHELVVRNANLRSNNAVPHGHYLVPMMHQGHVEGGICLYSQPHSRIDEDLIQILQSLSIILGSQLAASRARSEADRLTFYDPLTALPNRRLLLDRLQEAFQNAQRNRQFGAFILLDLDRFKPINDLHGHPVGDDFLRAIGNRLANGLRRRDTVGRYAGDEFVVLLEDLGTNAEVAARAAERVAQKVQTLVAKPVMLADCQTSLSASLGISIFPSPDQLNAHEVLRQADIALFRSKELGRDSFTIFEASMSSELREKRAFDQPLRGALERQEFSLQLQAKNDAFGAIQGAEVLLRWEHPELGHVPPEIFIPLAEESGAILPLGEWVLRQSCILLAQMAVLPQVDRPGMEYSLSVNVSPRQLRQSGFVKMLQQILDETGAPASRLTLEVTESQFLSNMDHVISTLKELRELGVRISIDDFGTGYSCLFYLQKLPLDELKIDQSFIQSAPKEPSHAVLIDTILTISRQLGLSVVAEGIESKAQLNFLVERGCNLFQGYYFGQPQAVSEFLATLDSRFGERRQLFAGDALVSAKDRADNPR